jgi:hypothetical protein
VPRRPCPATGLYAILATCHPLTYDKHHGNPDRRGETQTLIYINNCSPKLNYNMCHDEIQKSTDFKNNTNMDPYHENSITCDAFKKLPDDDPNMDRNM